MLFRTQVKIVFLNELLIFFFLFVTNALTRLISHSWPEGMVGSVLASLKHHDAWCGSIFGFDFAFCHFLIVEIQLVYV